MSSPLITMSAITGKPTRNEIFEYLKGLCDNGINEALLYPRSGCEIEYLSEEWFSTVGNFIECAKDLGMRIWLYDDFNWPSGDAGGRVTKIERFRLKAIGTAKENFGQISAKSRHNSSLFGEKFFPNLLSHEAVDYFIKSTHEEYYKRFGEYFGSIIKGIFTDEPSIGYCCSESSIPYYEGIEKDYFELYKRDFLEDMRGYEDFYPNAITLVSTRFKKCYVDNLATWCKEHDILMTGHLMCDDDPLYATRHAGNYLENLSSFSLPGIDEIPTQLDYRNEMALFGAIEYASGENGAMAELFALGPCDMSYAKKRCMLYLCACHKISNYFLAISHLDMRGNMLVTDFFNSFSTDQPNFSGMRLLSKEAEIASAYAKKDYTPQVYVRYPFSVCAKHVARDVDIEQFFAIVNDLTYNQIQWKLINDERVTNAPVIEFDSSFKPSHSIDEIIAMVGKNPIVTDESGDTPRGIFVRSFNDGSIVILNLFAPSNYYYVKGSKVYLEKHEVLLSLEKKEYKKEALGCEFDVTYHNPNIIRLMYLNDMQKSLVTCLHDASATFLLRKGQGACLNNEEISTDDCTLLPRGMKKLYTQSKSINLASGTYTVSSKNDFKYMPSVLIAGDFSAYVHKDGITLDKRNVAYRSGEAIYDYGKITFHSTVFVPQGAYGIEIEDTTQYTKVYLNDTLLGEKCTSPYVFELDKKLQGTRARLKIEQYSSIGPIFADVDYWDKNVINSQWRGTPSTTKEQFGFGKISWIF